MADKLLIAASLISLVQVGRVPAWMVVLIVCRDLAVTGLRAIAASQNLIIQASDFGKATMTTEVIAVALMILNWPAGVRAAGPGGAAHRDRPVLGLGFAVLPEVLAVHRPGEVTRRRREAGPTGTVRPPPGRRMTWSVI